MLGDIDWKPIKENIDTFLSTPNRHYGKILKDIADQIENLRVEIYSLNYIDDENDKVEFSDLLFSIQSKLRYEAQDIIECYEDEE